MEKNNVLSKDKIEVICFGKGENIDKAIEDAFRDMRVKVMEKVKYPIITLLTQEVYLLDKSIESKQEAFLYFFSKREVIEHIVNLKMVIDISYLKLN